MFHVELLLPFAASNHVGPICRHYRYQNRMHVVFWCNQITQQAFAWSISSDHGVAIHCHAKNFL